jgi:NADH:ubiquinone oxidoreductase subunit E
MFTIEDVRCLGCCSIAPVLKVDDEVYGHTSPDKALETLEKYRTQDAGTT